MDDFAHETRDSLSVIRGFAQLMRESELKDTDRADRYLALIIDEADRINARIEDRSP